MRKTLAILPATLLLLAGPAFALDAASFAAADLNADGAVDSMELGAAAGATFVDLDKNGDGVLSQEESAPIGVVPDLNGDGQTDLSEMIMGVQKDFTAADKDSDGVLRP